MRHLLLITASWLALAGAARSQVYVTYQTADHLDLSAGFAAGSWDLTWLDEENGISYATAGAPGATNWAIATLLGQSFQPRPAGAQFDFIGVPAGTNVYRVPESPAPFALQMGVGSEDNTPGTFASYFNSDPRVNATGEFITFRLKSLTGPGQVSAWTNEIGGPVVWLATSDGIGPSDTFYNVNGSHSDYNWAFTAEGTYQLTFEASAFLGPGQTNPTFSGDFVYTIVTVPEPTSLALVGLVAAGGAWRRFRVRRAA